MPLAIRRLPELFAPIRMRGEDSANLRSGQEPISKLVGLAQVGWVIHPFRDSGRYPWLQTREASEVFTRRDDRGGLRGPHERRPPGAVKRTPPMTLFGITRALEQQ
jgi:hypothetical protein